MFFNPPAAVTWCFFPRTMRLVQAWILSPLRVAAHVGSNFCGESLLLTLLVRGAPGIGCQIFGPLLPQGFPKFSPWRTYMRHLLWQWLVAAVFVSSAFASRYSLHTF